MKVSEAHFHELDQLREYLRDAVELVEQAGLSVEAHPELLVKVFELRSQKNIYFAQPKVSDLAIGTLAPNGKAL